MIEKIKKDLSLFIEKIPKEKRKLVLIALGVLLMLVISFVDITPSDSTSENATLTEKADYLESTESKLAEIISSIEGAGEAKVMLTLEAGEEKIYATDITDERNEYVIIKTNSQEGGLLLKIIQPKIRGVAIVCDGGDSYQVKNDIMSTVCSLLDISSSRVSITKME